MSQLQGSARVLSAGRVAGRFTRIVAPKGYRAEARYTRTTVTVHLRRG